MTKKEVLRDIRGLAAAGRVRVTSHGRLRMSQRGVTYADLRYGLTNASDCEAGEEGKWRVWTKDTSGDSLTIILFLQDGILIITVF
ncbi:MAG: DUF4258 domain-containing protein [Polyangiaceae bacterium]